MEKKVKLLSKRIFAFVLTFAMMLVIMPSIPARAEGTVISNIKLNVSNITKGNKVSDVVITVPAGEHYTFVESSIMDNDDNPFSNDKVFMAGESICVHVILEIEEGYSFYDACHSFRYDGFVCEGYDDVSLDANFVDALRKKLMLKLI